MNCIILLLLLFCGGNSCEATTIRCGQSRMPAVRRRLEDAGCCGDRDRRPSKTGFSEFYTGG